MFNIVPISNEKIKIKNHDALIVTSKNALYSLEISAQDIDKTKPLFTVGSETARLAKTLGYSSVFDAKGDVNKLEDLIQRPQFKDITNMIYLRGQTISRPLSISEKQISEHIVYQAKPVATFSDELLSALDNSKLDAVLFFSLRTADTFLNLINKYERTHTLRQISALCISNKLLSCIDESQWHDVRIAKSPNKDCMLMLL
jgi:uroporphyrinogen-III synthase